MGFSTLMDIVGSIIIGGVLLLILWRLDDAATENIINNGQEIALQTNLKTVALILEHDFRKIGYCKDWTKLPDPTQLIVQADSNSISFKTDDDNDGDVEILKYLVGPVSELSSTPNPRDKFLYRTIDGVVQKESNLGVTRFNLIYYNRFGDEIPSPVTEPQFISTIEINLSVEDSYAYDEKYSQAFWRQIRLAAKNLKNR